jgi:hypothetical protein
MIMRRYITQNSIYSKVSSPVAQFTLSYCAMCLVFMSVAFLVLMSAPSLVSAQLLGGGQEGIWYAQDSVTEGVVNRIYITLDNPLEGDVVGVVQFFIDDVLLTEQPFEVIDSHQIQSWIDWTPENAGGAKISIIFTDVLVWPVGGEKVPAEINIEGLSEEIIVDTDSDEDGVGDEEDSDDDNGGVSDEEEIAQGTDPKNPKDDSPVQDIEEKLGEVIDQVNSEVTVEEGVEQFIAPGEVSSGLKAFHETTKDLGDSLGEKREKVIEENEEKGFLKVIWGGILGIGNFIFSRPLITDILIVLVLIYVIRKLFKKKKRKYQRRNI